MVGNSASVLSVNITWTTSATQRMRSHERDTGAPQLGLQIPIDPVRDAARMVLVPAFMTEKLHTSKQRSRSGWSPGCRETLYAVHTSLMIWKEMCRNEATKFPIVTAGICEPTQNGGGTMLPEEGTQSSKGTVCRVASKQSWHRSSTRPRRFVNCCRTLSRGATETQASYDWKTHVVGVWERRLRKDTFTCVRFHNKASVEERLDRQPWKGS